MSLSTITIGSFILLLAIAGFLYTIPHLRTAGKSDCDGGGNAAGCLIVMYVMLATVVLLVVGIAIILIGFGAL